MEEDIWPHPLGWLRFHSNHKIRKSTPGGPVRQKWKNIIFFLATISVWIWFKKCILRSPKVYSLSAQRSQKSEIRSIASTSAQSTYLGIKNWCETLSCVFLALGNIKSSRRAHELKQSNNILMFIQQNYQRILESTTMSIMFSRESIDDVKRHTANEGRKPHTTFFF